MSSGPITSLTNIILNERSRPIKIVYFNARSLLPKINELQLLCLTECPDIVCVTESWLSGDISDCEIEIPGYLLCRLDRNRHGGGLITYFKNTMDYKCILSGPDNLELSVFLLHNKNCKLCLGLLYRPPSSPVSVFDSLCNILSSLDPSLLSHFVLLGDFNIDLCNSHHHLYSKLQCLLSMFSLSQVVTEPTHFGPSGKSLIDLVLLSQPSQLLRCSTIPPLGNSDHYGIFIALKWRVFSKRSASNSRSIWRYKYADFERACFLLDAINWDYLLPNDANSAWNTWKSIFLDIMEECIPRAVIRARHNLPWLDKSIVQAMKHRNRLYKAQKSTNNTSTSQQYVRARNKVTTMMRRAKRNFFLNLKHANSRDFWKAMKYLKKKQASIPSLRDSIGNVVTTASEKADVLNSFFVTCFNQSIPQLSPNNVSYITSSNCPRELLCKVDNVLEMLCTLDVSKASGPDGISGVMLKSTACSIAPVLTKIFNLSISTGVVPDDWKTSHIVPIPKSKDCAEAKGYRPISLLSICSKILEKHVSQLLSLHLKSSCPLSPNQWGFTAKKSTTTALLSVLHDWHQQLEEKKDVCAVFFDLQKAFDTVPHRLLMGKLESLGFDTYLLKWIHSYLSGRRQCVVLDGVKSTVLPVTSGVPQGSVLGPLLFIIYVDGVQEATAFNSTVVLYADDMVLYRPIQTLEDYSLLQSDVNEVSNWIEHLSLNFNLGKCTFMLFSNKRGNSVQPTITLNGCPLKEVFEFKYLGVYLTSDLSWSTHVRNQGVQ